MITNTITDETSGKAQPAATGVPLYALTLLEYRVALDMASFRLAHNPGLLVRCEQPALVAEVNQRLVYSDEPPWRSGLWIEPQRKNWQSTLKEFSDCLPINTRLAVLLSLPAARRLPERHNWQGSALGEHPGGLRLFLHALERDGFSLHSVHTLHSGQSVLLNAAAQLLRRCGQWASADRLEFAARRVYTLPLAKAWRATLAVLLARRR